MGFVWSVDTGRPLRHYRQRHAEQPLAELPIQSRQTKSRADMVDVVVMQSVQQCNG